MIAIERCESGNPARKPFYKNKFKTWIPAFAGMTVVCMFSVFSISAEKNPKNPIMGDAPDGSGRMLVLPNDAREALLKEFPAFRVPKDAEYNPEMLQYYNSRLIGVHPAVAFGDFNGDKKKDYAFLIITGDTKWGPLVELLVLNGRGGGFDSYRLGEVYNFKDDYVSFVNGKLYKGRYKKGGWHINWDKKKGAYNVLKS